MGSIQVEISAFAITRRADARRGLRELLGRRLAVPPDEVAIVEGDEEKPRLDPRRHHSDLRFNLSHSGELALIAIAEGIEVGVDVEQIEPDRSEEYLRDWTRKEAYLKGIGTGLGGGFRDLDFAPLGPGTWAVRKAGLPVENWRVVDLDLESGYVGALAAGSEVDVRLRLDPSLV